jgi:sulfur-oxidizing protein SoxA
MTAPKSGTFVVALLLGATVTLAIAAPEDERAHFLDLYRDKFPGIPITEYVNGAMMVSPDARAQFDSIMSFPPFQGEIEAGKRLWDKPFRNRRSLSDCFSDGGRNVAGNYPMYDEARDEVVTFEMAINHCLRANGEPELDYGDRASMGVLTAYARTLSDGMVMNIKVEGAGALRKFENGRDFYFRRIGQMNLACASCHLTYAGHYFRDEIISPAVGQAVHFPVFRGGEFLHTLHMRYQVCMEAVRAAPFAAGSQELNELEYFHSYLSNGLPLRSSVYRR